MLDGYVIDKDNFSHIDIDRRVIVLRDGNELVIKDWETIYNGLMAKQMILS